MEWVADTFSSKKEARPCHTNPTASAQHCVRRLGTNSQVSWTEYRWPGIQLLNRTCNACTFPGLMQCRLV